MWELYPGQCVASGAWPGGHGAWSLCPTGPIFQSLLQKKRRRGKEPSPLKIYCPFFSCSSSTCAFPSPFFLLIFLDLDLVFPSSLLLLPNVVCLLLIVFCLIPFFLLILLLRLFLLFPSYLQTTWYSLLFIFVHHWNRCKLRQKTLEGL